MGKDNKNSVKRVIRLTGFLLAAALCLAAFGSGSHPALAYTSLPHIEKIKNTYGSFTILEIVPDAAGGMLGYYVDGQEPIANWKDTIAALTSPGARRNWVNDKFGTLASNNILSTSTTDTAKPLTTRYKNNSNYYAEVYPWDNTSGYNGGLTLAAYETKSVKGTVSPSSAGAGAYLANYTYAIATGGAYRQDISHFQYGEQQGAFYYYNPIFTPIDQGSDIHSLPLKDKAIYTNEGGRYIKEGYRSELDGLDVSKQYYYVSATGAPSAFYSASTPYAAVGGDFTEKGSEPGYFSRGNISYTYVGTGGDSNFTANSTKPNVSLSTNTVFYKGGFTNNNWFKKYVFNLEDGELAKLNITVNTVAASQVNEGIIASADMVYLSAGCNYLSALPAYGTGIDLAPNSALAVYTAAYNKYPVIVDADVSEISDNNNVKKLASLLLKNTLAAPNTNENFSDLYNRCKNNTGTDYANDKDKTRVNGSVYVFDPFSPDTLLNETVQDTGATVKYLLTFGFTTNYITAVINDGFTAVLNEIKSENFYRNISGDATLAENVTIANAIRYIVNYSSRRVVTPKTAVRVLEIQPTGVSTKLSKSTVQGWVGTSVNQNQITITTMASSEFVGKLEDLNEIYDLIYIGASTERMNTRTQSGATITNYNDDSMDGLIYTNVGDQYQGQILFTGLLTRDYLTYNGTKYIDGRNYSKSTSSTPPVTVYRFSGNDITKSKVEEIKKFADAGYPVILADGLMSGSSVNGSRVDNSSYMYEALDAIRTKANVRTEDYATGHQTDILSYLNLSKPEIRLTSQPTPYADSQGALTAAADGFYYLNYTFTIGNATDPTPLSTTYDFKLYIDVNADGRFGSSEELKDAEIRRADGTLVTKSAGKYTLSEGVAYTVGRQMPKGFAGIIPWKIEVNKNNASYIHSSEQGYTRISAAASKASIKILQIASNGQKSNAINLETQLQVDNNTNPQLKAKNSNTYYKGIYGKLIADLDDFTVTIKTIDTSELNNLGSTSAAVLTELLKYDMLIIGFYDCYDGIAEKGATAITEYIKKGKSVLFTHDTTSFGNNQTKNTRVVSNWNGSGTPSTTADGPEYWGYYFNTVIRDVVGLDRYGITSSLTAGGSTLKSLLSGQTYGNTNASKNNIAAILANQRGVAYEPKSGKVRTEVETQGFTNYELMRFADTTYFGSSQLKATKNVAGGDTGRETSTVSQVNRGQITTYPYDINTADFGGSIGSQSYMQIGNTHEQYYQINMNTDDIVVWYCLSGGANAATNSMYYDVPNDVVNSYYIYNKGNVTYSGVGHTYQNGNYTGSSIGTQFINEAKLFVNTMIAAYQSGSQTPTVRITDTSNGNSDLEAVFFTADDQAFSNALLEQNSAAMAETSKRVYFKISDSNLSDAKTLEAQFYYADAGGTQTLSVGGSNVKVRSFTPEIKDGAGNAVNRSALQGGVVYSFQLPDGALNLLKQGSIASVKVYIKALTTIDGVALSGENSIDSFDLMKIGLFDLN